jgi:hypothetical protein
MRSFAHSSNILLFGVYRWFGATEVAYRRIGGLKQQSNNNTSACISKVAKVKIKVVPNSFCTQSDQHGRSVAPELAYRLYHKEKGCSGRAGRGLRVLC